MALPRSNTMFLDAQFHRGPNGEPFVKELAYIMGNSTRSHVITFRPLFSFEELSVKEKMQAEFDQKYIHGLPWNGGEHEYESLYVILTRIRRSTNVKHVVIKGDEKQKFFQPFLRKTVQAEMPGKLCDSTLRYDCSNHFYPVNRCALKNVYTLYYFYMENGLLD